MDDPSGRGSWNMAMDEALLEGLATGASGPTLRFYGWDPPALSLGYSQSLADVDVEACERLGVDIIRRPTGGRAVLHVAELTYSVTAEAGQESVADSYCRISKAIARAIGRLGISASLEPGSSRGTGTSPAPAGRANRTADCFALSTAADLVAAGRKIVGSAQVRRRGFLLQHGSIKLEPAPIHISQVLASTQAPVGTATLADLLGQPADALCEPLKRMIAQELDAAWVPEAPSEVEIAMARTIEARSSSSLRRPDRLRPARD